MHECGPRREVTDGVLWGELGYDREEAGPERYFRWTRPRGTMLVPVDAGDPAPGPLGPLRLTLRLGAEAIKPVELSWPGGAGSVKSDADPAEVDPPEDTVEVPAAPGRWMWSTTPAAYAHGKGTDLGFRQVDRGQHDRPADVFAFCGAAVCFRTSALRAAGYFDDNFLLYYEDTDLAWRLWTLGWRVRYVPTSVVRHKLSATLGESRSAAFLCRTNRLLLLTQTPASGGPPGMLVRPSSRMAGHSAAVSCQVSPAPAGGFPPAAAAPVRVAGRTCACCPRCSCAGGLARRSVVPRPPTTLESLARSRHR